MLLASVRSALNKLNQDQRREAERNEIEGRLAALSNRERDVLEGLVSGQANKQIAYDLGISPRTIEIYRANLMTKMQAASLSDLVHVTHRQDSRSKLQATEDLVVLPSRR